MKKILLTGLLLVGIVIPLVACAGEATEAPTESAEATAVEEATVALEPIKIGSIQDLTGGASVSGKANAWGAEYAVQVINENGGINGRPLEIITEDCKNDLDEGINAYHKLVDVENVVAIIGPPLSNPASGWVELSAEDKVPIVGHFMDEICTTNPETGEPYPYMFLVEPSCSAQSYAIAKFALENLGLKKFATLYNTGNAFAVAHAKPFMEYVKQNGGEVVAEENFTWSDTDYSAQALKIVAAAPDAVFLSDYANQAALAYDFLRDAGYEGVILGANTVAPPFASLVKNEIHDVYYLQNYDIMNPESPAYELFQKYMQESGAEYPLANVGFGWDAVQVLAAAMKKAKDPTDGVELRDLLEQTVGVKLCDGRTITLDPKTHRPNNLGMYIADYDENNNIHILTYIEP